MSKKGRTRRNPNDRNHQALFTYTRSLPSYEIADLIEGKAKKFKSNVSAKLFDQDHQHIKEALANIIGSSPQREKSFATYYTTTLQPLLHQIIAEKQESEKGKFVALGLCACVIVVHVSRQDSHFSLRSFFSLSPAATMTLLSPPPFVARSQFSTPNNHRNGLVPGQFSAVGSSMNRYGAEHFPQPNFQPVPVIAWATGSTGFGGNWERTWGLATWTWIKCNEAWSALYWSAASEWSLRSPPRSRSAKGCIYRGRPFTQRSHKCVYAERRSGDVRNAYTDIEERAKNDIAEINIQIEELVRAHAIQETTVKKVEKCRLTVDSVFTKSIQGGNNVLTQIENHIKKPTAPATYWNTHQEAYSHCCLIIM